MLIFILLLCFNGLLIMKSIEKTVTIPEDKRLYLELPPDTPTGEVNISLTIKPIPEKITK
jgi:hypothetical protein